MARPVTPLPRDVRLMTRVTREQAEAIRSRAQRLNMSVSAYLVAAALEADLHEPTTPPEINRKLYLELSRYNSNLNQIAHHLNQGKVRGKAEILANLRGMYALIRQVRKELRG